MKNLQPSVLHIKDTSTNERHSCASYTAFAGSIFIHHVLVLQQKEYYDVAAAGLHCITESASGVSPQAHQLLYHAHVASLVRLGQ